MEKEIEYKVLLSKWEWEAIKEYCEQNACKLASIFGSSLSTNKFESAIQTNHYFDEDEILFRHQTVCRLRCFKNVEGEKLLVLPSPPLFFFKAKAKRAEHFFKKAIREEKAQIHTSFECSQVLLPKEAEEILARGVVDTRHCETFATLSLAMQNWLNETKQAWTLPTKLNLLGKLTTKRYLLGFEDLSFCFDHNLYFDKEDFELEMEGSEAAIQVALAQLLPRFQALSNHASLSKFQRFYSCLVKGSPVT